MLNTVRIAMIESCAYNEGTFRKKNHSGFIKELSTDNREHVGLYRLDNEDRFINIFNKLCINWILNGTKMMVINVQQKMDSTPVSQGKARM